ncbi:transcription-associated protein 1-like isoform 1-T1 [Glossina fuscipes fuscipes]
MVFHSLLKGHALEERSVVRQVLDVLTPAMPLPMEDGNTMQQLFHILQLIVRHYKVYFPVVTHLVNLRNA